MQAQVLIRLKRNFKSGGAAEAAWQQAASLQEVLHIFP
jgi:hypothetical protein